MIDGVLKIKFKPSPPNQVNSAGSNLSGLIEARQPSDLRRSLFGSVAAGEAEQRSFTDQQHVSDTQVDVLLPLLLVVVQRSVLEALRAHPAVWVRMALEKLTKLALNKKYIKNSVYSQAKAN